MCVDQYKPAGVTIVYLGPPGPPGPTGPQGPPGQSGGGGTGSAQLVFGETPIGAVNGATTTFNTVNHFAPNTLAVFLNGLRQARTNDYTETGANSFTFLVAPLSGDLLSVDYVQA